MENSDIDKIHIGADSANSKNRDSLDLYPIDVKKFPLILGSSDFKPTILQQRVLWTYIMSEIQLSAWQVLKRSGHSAGLWSLWSKKAGFLDWWTGCLESVYKNRLFDVYGAFYRRAITHDTAAGKIYVQRFDEKFAEKTSSEHSFKGFEPNGGNTYRAVKRLDEFDTVSDSPDDSAESPDIERPDVDKTAED